METILHLNSFLSRHCNCRIFSFSLIAVSAVSNTEKKSFRRTKYIKAVLQSRHGDNIVECERIANIIIQTLNPHKVSTHLISPSTIAIEIQATYSDISFEWRLELLPGFNKNTKKRWEQNIFDALKDAGSFFDETPDAIISEVCGSNEQIKLAIEFCSALQAGNQA